MSDFPGHSLGERPQWANAAKEVAEILGLPPTTVEQVPTVSPLSPTPPASQAPLPEVPGTELRDVERRLAELAATVAALGNGIAKLTERLEGVEGELRRFSGVRAPDLPEASASPVKSDRMAVAASATAGLSRERLREWLESAFIPVSNVVDTSGGVWLTYRDLADAFTASGFGAGFGSDAVSTQLLSSVVAGGFSTDSRRSRTPDGVLSTFRLMFPTVRPMPEDPKPGRLKG